MNRLKTFWGHFSLRAMSVLGAAGSLYDGPAALLPPNAGLYNYEALGDESVEERAGPVVAIVPNTSRPGETSAFAGAPPPSLPSPSRMPCIHLRQPTARLPTPLLRSMCGFVCVWPDEGAAWNEPFQTALDKPSVTPKDAEQRLSTINKLAEAFVSAAQVTVFQIVNELHLEPSAKTVRPIDAGGIAGGIKFLHKGQFFKVRSRCTPCLPACVSPRRGCC